MDKKVNCQKICAALLSHNRHLACKWPIAQEIHLARSSSRPIILGPSTPSAGRPNAPRWKPLAWGLLAIWNGWTWIGNSLYLFASVVNRDALTQPQRRRGTKDHIPCLNSPTYFSEEPIIACRSWHSLRWMYNIMADTPACWTDRPGLLLNLRIHPYSTDCVSSASSVVSSSWEDGCCNMDPTAELWSPMMNASLLITSGSSSSVITSGCRGREDPSPSGEGMNRAPPLCRKL